MAHSKSAGRLREIIEKAIDDHKITRSEMDEIVTVAAEDGHIDPQEQALLDQLQDLIENKSVRIMP